MSSSPGPVRLLVACTMLGTTAGVVFGFIRGLYYLPTLPFALIEGGILFGVPAALLGVLLASTWWFGSAVRRRACPLTHR